MKIVKITEPSNKADEIYNVVAQCCNIYKDENGECYLIRRTLTGYQFQYLSSSSEAKEYITQLCITKENRTVKSSDVKTAYEALCARGKAEANVVPVFTRIASYENKIIYDLANSSGEVAVISEKSFQVTPFQQRAKFYFNKHASLQTQKQPIASKEYGLLNFIDEFLNIDENQRILFAVYICCAFIPNISHPILIVEGEKGAGKSTLLRYLLSIINPNRKDVLGLPKKEDDLVVALSNNYFTAFDNVGKISDEVSNVLCQAVTGGTIVKRKLYTDNTEISINIKRLVAINGINLDISQSDLLDRAIAITLKRISSESRKPESEIFQRFNEVLPYILGDIFNILSKALQILPTIKRNSYPRMADFSKYGFSIAEAIKQGYGDMFVEQYAINEKTTTEMAIEADPLLESVRLFAEKNNYWYGDMTTLLKKLRACCKEIYIGRSIPASFPEKANTLSKKLNQHRAELHNMGISVDIGRNTSRYVVIEKIRAVDIDDTDE